MIQNALFFALGAFGAALLALLAAPAYRRRAERAARRRLEARMPLTMNEIEAGRDALRADLAAAQARMEEEAKALRERQAEQAVAAGRAEERARVLGEEKAALERTAQKLEAEGAALRENLARREERVAALERESTEATAEAERLARELEETTYLASSRQIDLVARDTELERLGGEMKAAQAAVAKLETERAAARETAQAERRRERDAAERAETLTGELFAAEERIARGRGEAERLRRELDAGAADRRRAAEELVEAQKERVGLEVELAALRRQLAGLFPGVAPGGDPARSLEAAAAERDRLEARLAKLQRENRDLAAALSRAPAMPARETTAPPAPEAMLRDEMLGLAAQVTALAARLEGPDGPIAVALRSPPGRAEEGPQPSLADRVRALLRDESAEKP